MVGNTVFVEKSIFFLIMNKDRNIGKNEIDLNVIAEIYNTILKNKKNVMLNKIIGLLMNFLFMFQWI
jgi:hypothetical protein